MHPDKQFEEIYLQYFSRMKRFAREYVLLDEDAENVLQDVFLDFWMKRELFLSHDNPVAFLYTAVRNRCIDLLRRRMLEQEASNRIQEEYLLTMKINLDSLEALDQHIFYQHGLEEKIDQAIANLPEKCREIFILSKIEGKKQKEIAQMLNISVNTVETQMGIAYRKLKESLKNYYPALSLFCGFFP